MPTTAKPKVPILEVITKLLSKSQQFFLLSSTPDYLIVGYILSICHHKEMTGNPFQPYSQDKDKEIAVFFYIGQEKKNLSLPFTRGIGKVLLHQRFFEGKITLEAVEKILEEFVKSHFLS